MEKTYPQETMGTTLLDVNNGDEYRRVYMRKKDGYVEVGEFTRGQATQDAYGAPVHLHCIHLEDMTLLEELPGFFESDEPLLSDYMDSLDARGIAYGYLNSETGDHVSYRPARLKKRIFS